MYGCMKYFRERYMTASINISNSQIQLCTRVTQYMQEKIEKAKLHRVISTGTIEHRFEFYARIEVIVVSIEIGWYRRV